MRQRRLLTIAVVSTAVVSTSAPLIALEARVTQLRTTGSRLFAAFEVRDLLRDNFLRLVREGRSVFVQLEADFWEDRRVFDRIVVASPPGTWRIDRTPDDAVVMIQDQYGESKDQQIRLPLSLRIDLGPAARVDDEATYYVHAKLTAATVDERDIEQAGEALFGDEQTTKGLAGLGRFVFRTLLRMGKYFESSTTETNSRRISGRDIKRGVF